MKYYLTSDLVTTHLSGYVEAESEEEAIEKYQSGDLIGEYYEEHTREEINIQIKRDDK